MDLPLSRNRTQRRILELFGMSCGVTEVSLPVHAACRQVVKQPGLHLVELADHRISLPDRCVCSIEDFSDAALLRKGWQVNADSGEVPVTNCAPPVHSSLIVNGVLVEQRFGREQANKEPGVY